MARRGHHGPRAGAGRPPGSKNKVTGEFQKWYREQCQRMLQRPKVLKFMQDLIDGNPVESKFYEVKDPETGLYVQKVKLVPADPKLRLDAIRDLRDGSGCKPILLLEGNKEGTGSGVKPSFNISISVV